MGKEVAAQTLPEHQFRAFSRKVQAQAFPIGIDVEKFAALSRGKDATDMYERMTTEYLRRRLLLGVERLD